MSATDKYPAAAAAAYCSTARNASTSSPVSQDMMMLQGLGGPYLLQLLMMRIQSQQGLSSASAALATARNSQLQFPVPWASSDVSTSSSFSQDQILHGLGSDPCFLQNVLQNIPVTTRVFFHGSGDRK
jgi:hypothetical protein